ncbi:MAG: HAMP domain-containing sensor histidine kinase [Phycisphaerae bacterium]|nr:HAMP domain-containing sensor histidine kinase [Phycisphaerae bacterium]
MIRRSVTFRLVRAVLALEVALIVGFGLSVYFQTAGNMRRYFDSLLQARADGIALMIDNADGVLRMEKPLRPNTRPASNRNPKELSWVWSDAQAEIEGAPSPRGLKRFRDAAKPPAVGKRVVFDVESRDTKYRAIWSRVVVPPDHPTTAPDAGPREANVLLALSRRAMDDAVADTIEFLLILSGGLLLATGVATVLLVRWGLWPIREAAGEIEAITTANVGLKPVGTPNPPEEIRPFTQALNDMLARLGRAFRQQRDFTANASHELRTPMAVIKSTLQGCLLRPRGEAEYREAFGEVLDDLTRMEQVIDQLLLLAKLDGRVEQNAVQPVDLSDMLTDLAARYQSQADAASVALTPPEVSPAVVSGNAELLELLFSNLLGNAIQHNRPGGSVRLWCGSRDGSAVVEVSDTGPGIPAESLERIFDRFYRADPSRTRRQGNSGTGLGLAIVREIATVHGGTVSAENQPGGGAMFRVRLPLASNTAPATD